LWVVDDARMPLACRSGGCPRSFQRPKKIAAEQPSPTLIRLSQRLSAPSSPPPRVRPPGRGRRPRAACGGRARGGVHGSDWPGAASPMKLGAGEPVQPGGVGIGAGLQLDLVLVRARSGAARRRSRAAARKSSARCPASARRRRSRRPWAACAAGCRPGRRPRPGRSARTRRPRCAPWRGRAGRRPAGRSTRSTWIARWMRLWRIGETPGNEPGVAALGTPDIRQVAGGAADLDPAQVQRPAARRVGEVDMRRGERVDDAEEQRRGSVHPDQRRIAAAVEMAHPDHQRVGPDQSRAPGIAETPAGAGLPRHAQRVGLGQRAEVRARVLRQHVAHDEGGLGSQQRLAGRQRQAVDEIQWLPLAIVAEQRVELHQLLHGHFAAAEHQRQPVSARRWPSARCPPGAGSRTGWGA
jgi:hypothetical protein